MPVTPKTLRLSQQTRRDLLKLVDQHEKAITAAWVDAWDEVAGDLEVALRELITASQSGVLSQATILRSQRLQLALDVVARRLTRLTTDAGATVTADLARMVREASEVQREIVASQLPAVDQDALDTWTRVDQRQMDAIVQRSTERITSQMWPLSAEADAAMRREIVRGLATGAGPRDTARAIVKRAEGQFNGGLARALTIARTEMLDSQRAAAKASQDANADVLAGWIWLTALSSRTCPACLSMSGSEHPLSEPGPQGHANCRCTRAPKTKSWRDLGIDLDEPASALPDAREWFEAQPEAVQVRIMGRRRLDLLRSGEASWSDLATKKANPNWRPSWQVTPVASLARKRSA